MMNLNIKKMENMKKQNFTRKEVIKLIDEMFENPDAIIDYLQNENTNYDIEELMSFSSMNELDKRYEKREVMEFLQAISISENTPVEHRRIATRLLFNFY